MKIKNLIVGLTLLCAALPALAGKPLVAEAPVNDVGTAETVSVSTSAWTAAPTDETVGRTGILVNNPSSNTGRMVGILSTDCDGSIATATTIRPLEFAPGTDFTFVGVSDKACLYLLNGTNAI